MQELSSERLEKLVHVAGGVSAGQAVAAAHPKAPAIPQDQRTAIVEAMFLMAAVDGDVAPEELARFAQGVERILGPATAEDVAATLGTMARNLETEGWDRRIKSIARTLAGRPEAETAYRLATGIAFVDDHVAHAESAALDALAAALGLASERAHAIMSEVHRELFG